MSRHSWNLTARAALVAAILSAVAGLPARAATVQDTFTRPDSTDLGTTEVGGSSYIEARPDNFLTLNTADIVSGELRVFGDTATPATPTSNVGMALIGANLSDVSLAADMRLTLPNGPTANTSTFNYSGFVLRKNSVFSGTGIQNEGMIQIQLQVGGALWIREVKNGAINALNTTNLFGLGGTNDNTYGAPGSLPVTFNGLPFDANGNGRLDPNEPFRLSANLVGNQLTVGVNGQQIFSGATTASAPTQALSYSGLLKNTFTGSGTRDITVPFFDNVVLTGTDLAVPAILHTGQQDPVSAERWTTMPGTVPASVNAAVNDGGVNAWKIQDTSTASGSFANYQRALTPEQGSAAKTLGWSMKGRLKVLGIDDVADGAIELSAFPDSLIGYTLWFGANEFGQTTVSEFGGTTSPAATALGRTYTVPGGTAYHDYEMIFDPASQQTNLFVDGTLALANLLKLDRTGSGSLNRILWGSNASAGTGEANFASVEFRVIPEPTSAALLLIAVTFGIALRRKDG